MKRKALMLTVLLGLGLGGCGLTPQGDALRETVATSGATAADALLANLLWGACNAATIGSVIRRFGNDPEGAAAYTRLCLQSREAVLLLLQKEGAAPVGTAP